MPFLVRVQSVFLSLSSSPSLKISKVLFKKTQHLGIKVGAQKTPTETVGRASAPSGHCTVASVIAGGVLIEGCRTLEAPGQERSAPLRSALGGDKML